MRGELILNRGVDAADDREFRVQVPHARYVDDVCDNTSANRRKAQQQLVYLLTQRLRDR